MSDYKDQCQRSPATPTNYGNAASVASRDDLDRARKSNHYRKLIYEHICLYGIHGATCDEIEERLQIRHQTASCFITVLQKQGMITASGSTRPARSGRNVTVWTRKFNGTEIKAIHQDELFPVKPTFRQEF